MDTNRTRRVSVEKASIESLLLCFLRDIRHPLKDYRGISSRENTPSVSTTSIQQPPKARTRVACCRYVANDSEGNEGIGQQTVATTVATAAASRRCSISQYLNCISVGSWPQNWPGAMRSVAGNAASWSMAQREGRLGISLCQTCRPGTESFWPETHRQVGVTWPNAGRVSTASVE